MSDVPERRLVRFRADPEKVRVSIRRSYSGDAWIAGIGPRGQDPVVRRIHKSPLKAMQLALNAAHLRRVPGMDVGMQWAYEHPFPEPPLADRYERDEPV